ncbi:hypothetical protein ACFXDE_14545 [Kitasatospora sp. NPDC059408]|uniref:hypothetical protein n=1 Tax=Kitasatospora sp. NPDC059408 TaxID=3346823 RepID=UPI0036C51237
MTGTDFTHPDRPDGPGGADTGEEQELRILLQQAAPHLAAPEDRIQRILDRADRTRRRRRAAGLGAGLTGGLLAAVLAAAPAIAPSGPHSGPLGAAGAPAPAPSTAAPSPSPAPEGPDAVGPLGPAISFRSVPEMVVNVPKGWFTQDSGGSSPLRSIGTLANQELIPLSSCPAQQSICFPVGKLYAGGVVLTFRLVDDAGTFYRHVGQSGPGEVTAVGKECASAGGSDQLVGYRTVGTGATSTLVELTACFRGPSLIAAQQVAQVLESIRSAERNSPAAKDSVG